MPISHHSKPIYPWSHSNCVGISERIRKPLKCLLFNLRHLYPFISIWLRLITCTSISYHPLCICTTVIHWLTFCTYKGLLDSCWSYNGVIVREFRLNNLLQLESIVLSQMTLVICWAEVCIKCFLSVCLFRLFFCCPSSSTVQVLRIPFRTLIQRIVISNTERKTYSSSQ